MGVLASLVTSAAVANRAVRLQINDGNLTYFDLPAAAVQAASLTRVYQWGPTLQAVAIGGGIESPMPEVTLQAGSIIRVVTDLIDVTDQWGAPVIYVEETLVQAGDFGLDDVPDMVVEIAGFVPVG